MAIVNLRIANYPIDGTDSYLVAFVSDGTVY